MSSKAEKVETEKGADGSRSADCNKKENPLMRWNATQSPEILHATQSKAGIASGKARREKADLNRYIRQQLERDPDGFYKVIYRILTDDSRPTNQLKAWELVSKAAGLLSDKVTIAQDKPFVSIDLKSLSDGELIELADKQIVDSD